MVACLVAQLEHLGRLLVPPQELHHEQSTKTKGCVLPIFTGHGGHHRGSAPKGKKQMMMTPEREAEIRLQNEQVQSNAVRDLLAELDNRCTDDSPCECCIENSRLRAGGAVVCTCHLDMPSGDCEMHGVRRKQMSMLHSKSGKCFLDPCPECGASDVTAADAIAEAQRTNKSVPWRGVSVSTYREPVAAPKFCEAHKELMELEVCVGCVVAEIARSANEVLLTTTPAPALVLADGPGDAEALRREQKYSTDACRTGNDLVAARAARAAIVDRRELVAVIDWCVKTADKVDDSDPEGPNEPAYYLGLCSSKLRALLGGE